MKFWDAFFSPTLETWWQFAIILVGITLIALVIFRTVFSLIYSEDLHPKAAKTLGTMTALLIITWAIIITLFIDVSNHWGRVALAFFNYVVPLAVCLIYLVLFFIYRARLGLGTKAIKKT